MSQSSPLKLGWTRSVSFHLVGLFLPKLIWCVKILLDYRRGTSTKTGSCKRDRAPLTLCDCVNNTTSELPKRVSNNTVAPLESTRGNIMFAAGEKCVFVADTWHSVP